MDFEKLLEQEARKAARQDYEEVTEKTKDYTILDGVKGKGHIHIRSSKEITDSEEIFRQLHLGYVPKGYHILYETENPTTMYDVYYEGANDNYITFMQGFKENVDVHITYDGTGRKRVQVNGKEIYMIKDGNITSYYYEDGEYLITLSGTEKESELIKMLKSLK